MDLTPYPPHGQNSGSHIINITEEAKQKSWAMQVKKKLVTPYQLPYLGSHHPTIFRVPEHIRASNPIAYSPRVVAVGPYHRSTLQNRDIIFTLQQYKSICARFLLSRHHDESKACELLNTCLAKMKELNSKTQHCYAGNDPRLSDEELAELMFFDGCFILRLLLTKGDHDRRLVSYVLIQIENMAGITLDIHEGESIPWLFLRKLWIWKLVAYDLLKLENQIPFFILEALFDILKTEEDKGVSVVDLALNFFTDIQPSKSKTFKPKGTYLHLLHLFHSSLISNNEKLQLDRTITETMSDQYIPSAMNLKRAGVQFKKKQNPASFLDVSFKRGILEMPSIYIMNCSDSLFRNLISFEQFYPFIGTEITTYFALMDCLINSVEDANLLQMKGIIKSRISTCDIVVELFSNLKNQIPYNLEGNYLHDVFVNVNRFHQSKRHQWIACLKSDYMGTPWSIISLVAASTLLVLSILQALFASYDFYRPHNGG